MILIFRVRNCYRTTYAEKRRIEMSSPRIVVRQSGRTEIEKPEREQPFPYLGHFALAAIIVAAIQVLMLFGGFVYFTYFAK